MASTAIEGAARLLTDLGLTAQRPFRIIDAEGTPSDVATPIPRSCVWVDALSPSMVYAR